MRCCCKDISDQGGLTPAGRIAEDPLNCAIIAREVGAIQQLILMALSENEVVVEQACKVIGEDPCLSLTHCLVCWQLLCPCWICRKHRAGKGEVGLAVLCQKACVANTAFGMERRDPFEYRNMLIASCFQRGEGFPLMFGRT